MSETGVEGLQQAFEASDVRTSQAEVFYRALTNSPGQLRRTRRVQYRCAQARCLLLDAIETPLGVLLHQNRYKYSEAENARRSNESGRRANTYDGANHWRERTYFIDQSGLAHPEDDPPGVLGITCDHVLEYRLTASEFRDDFDTGHAEIRVRPDGTRYVR